MDLVTMALSVVYIITLFYTTFWLITLLEVKEEKKKHLKKFPFISVLVPAYNEEDNIIETLNSLVSLDYPSNKLEIIVINDGSTDSTKQVAERFIGEHKRYDIKLINQDNQGKWVALNKALKIAKGEFFACLDADSSIEKAALKKMLPYFTNSNVAAVLPLIKIKNPKGILQKVQHYEYLINMFYKRIMSHLNCVHVTPGPFSVYRKKIVDKLGGFRKGHNTEDLELALRIQKHNYKIIQLGGVEVRTYLPNNMKDLYYQRHRWNRGALLNVWDYKKMVFNKKYGDFGMLQLPMVLCSGFLAMIVIFFMLYHNILKPLIKSVHNLSLVNFDIFSFITNFEINFNLLDFNYYKLIIMGTVLVIAFVVILLSHKYTQEKIAGQGVLSLVAYIFIYYLFLGTVWLGITKDLILRRVKEW